jgi:hypothetical protein
MGEKAASRPWSKEEDDLLKCAIETHGTRDNWKAVAAAVPGRTNKACRKVGGFPSLQCDNQLHLFMLTAMATFSLSRRQEDRLVYRGRSSLDRVVQ